MKKILVTGGNGQLGRELHDLSPSFKSFEFTFTDVAELDLLDSARVTGFLAQNNFDFVINCAAYTAVDKAEAEEELCRKINADAVLVLAKAIKKTSARLIHVSTDYVLNGNAHQPVQETAKPEPLSVYGKTKLEGENHVLNELKNAYIIRTAWVYSSHGANFVKTIMRLTGQKTELGIVADQFGTPTYARDLAATILSIVESVALGKVDSPGVYHYTNEGTASWYDFAFTINENIGSACRILPIKTEDYKTAAARPAFSVLDKTKIKKTFGLEIPHWTTSLKECLTKMKL